MLGDHELVAQLTERLEPQPGLVEQLDSTDFEELHERRMVQMTVRIELIEPDLQFETVRHAGRLGGRSAARPARSRRRWSGWACP